MFIRKPVLLPIFTAALRKATIGLDNKKFKMFHVKHFLYDKKMAMH